MKKIRIVADSTCDLSADLIEKHDITIIPLCIIMDDKSYYDGVDVTPDDIFAWADKNKTTPKTAAASFDLSLEKIQSYIDNGDDIIFIGISLKMSTTCNILRLIADQEEYPRLFVIDSENLSTGIGLQVLRAAELAESGATSEEIVAEIEEARSRVRASFVVDTLTFLARGGRCTAAKAMMATALKFHPLITVKDGAMGAGKKYRGKMSAALQSYVDDLKPSLLTAEPKRVFITHSGSSEETINAVKKELEALNYFEEILVTRAGGVISSHCGPNTLGVLFYAGK